MLLTFSSHQMMYNVSYVVPFTEVTCKCYLVIPLQCKKTSTRPLITSSIFLDLCFIPELATIIFILLS